MRWFRDRTAGARPEPSPELHEWSARARALVEKRLAVSRDGSDCIRAAYAAATTDDEREDILPDMRRVDGDIDRRERVLGEWPAAGTDWAAASGYVVVDPDSVAIGVAMKAIYVPRTGSFKTSRDYWLAVRPNGGSRRCGGLEPCAVWLLQQWTAEVAEARQARLDQDALGKLEL